MSLKERHARNLVIMLTAKGDLAEVLEMAKLYQIRATHIQQLAIPKEEEAASRILIQALKQINELH